MMSWLVMNGLHGTAELFVCQRGHPSGSTFNIALQMQAYRLNQHHLDQMLCDQNAAWSWSAQFLSHSFQ
jgi:hypothetical protein